MDLFFAAENGDVTSCALTSKNLHLLASLAYYLLSRSMKLTEVYKHNMQRNEQLNHTFFIITYSCYELHLVVTNQGV